VIVEQWICTKTFDVVDEGYEGAVLLEIDMPEPPETYGSSLEDAELGDWVSRELCELDALEAAHKEQAKRRSAQLKARRRALEAYLPEIEAATRRLLTGKRKSVDFAFGRAGFRSSRKVEVIDATEAMIWADEHCPDAIKTPAPTLLVSMLPRGEEIPGVRVVEGESFSVKAAGGAK